MLRNSVGSSLIGKGPNTGTLGWLRQDYLWPPVIPKKPTAAGF